MKLAFDLSSILKTCLYGGKDDESGYEVEFEGKKIWVNSAHHGYEKCLNRMLEVMKEFNTKPIDVILVPEGDRSKHKRLMIDATYKSGGASSHPKESNEEFHKAKNMLIDLWRGLGSLSLIQDLAEGDDTLAWLALNVEEDLTIVTFDNDLAALNMVNEYGATVQVWVNGLVGINKYGLFDFNLITTYKALVGDTSDNIKGCPQFGPGAFEKFVAEYGFDGLAEVQSMLLDGDLSPIDKLCLRDPNKQLKMIADNKEIIQRSFNLARLRPEWVNTMQHPLQCIVGMVRHVKPTDDPRLKPWYGRVRLITAENFGDACEFALEKIAQSKSVALDIETTDADESDEWLANQKSSNGKVGVDVFGSTLTSLGLTFGDNNQFTFFFSVDHADTDNIPSEALRQFIAKIPQTVEIVIQNTSFELVVLFNEWAERQLDNGYRGFLPNVLDTKIEANYVNENIKSGLKESSQLYLGYKQQTYDEVTTLTGPEEELPKGGRIKSVNYLYMDRPTGKMVPSALDPDVLIEEVKRELVEETTGEFEEVVKGKKTVTVPIMRPVVDTVTKQYKMRELSARHVLGYGSDDPICTAALHNFYKFNMQTFDHHWHIYKEVEIDPCYLHAKSFIDGVPISLEELNAQAAHDTKVYDGAWKVLRAYLMDNGWEGTIPPKYTRAITVAEVKEAFAIVTGEELGTMMRTMSKLIIWIREEKEQPVLAALLERLVDESIDDPQMIAMNERKFTDYVCSFYKNEPKFNDGSPIQMCRLLYDVMKLPVRVRNAPTDIMKAKGIYEGNPKADDLALQYALQDAPAELVPVIEALKNMGTVGTRRGLYYNTYPYFPHWKDGMVRSQHNQASTNTRRASMSKPNLQQLPKHPKAGLPSEFRAVIVPHKENAVVVSIDFDSQEMRLIGEQSGDKVVLSMFVGENLRGPHSLTGLAIAMRKKPKALGELSWSYEVFEEIRDNKEHPEFDFVKACRVLGKKLNFVAEYGAMAPKVAATLLISEEEAQELLDAREEMFPDVVLWKKATIAETKEKGYVLTMLGAKRHLRDALMSEDRFISSKAERQGVNYKVQGSAGEMTKLAEGRLWRDGLYFDYDALFYTVVHDEAVSSCVIDQLVPFIQRKHACMAVQYAGMKIPVVGSISFGLDFYHQVEIGIEPTREAIEAGLKKMWKEAAERDAKKMKLAA